MIYFLAVMGAIFCILMIINVLTWLLMYVTDREKEKKEELKGDISWFDERKR